MLFQRYAKLIVAVAAALTTVSYGPVPRHPAPASPGSAGDDVAPREVQASARARAGAAGPSVADAYGRLPLAFERNVGQTDPRVDFVSRGAGYTLFVAGRETVLALTKRTSVKARSIATKTAALRMRFAGSASRPRPVALEPLPGVTNYFIGKDPAKWHADVESYGRVQYRDLYPGIDLVYYGNQRQLEYDFVVAPGASPDAIRLDVAGADRIEIDADGNLQLHVDDQQIALKKPVAYQRVAGVDRGVPIRYALDRAREVRLQVDAYDAALPLVIDPTLLYSTYLGGTGSDFAAGIAVGGAGSVVVTGVTSSLDFPATAGAAQPASGGGSGEFVSLPLDAFVAKLNAAGSALIYATYLGGSGDEFSFGLAVDAADNAYVTGTTASTDFPTTAGAFQTAYGGKSDAFVTKLSPSGALVYSTYLGGGCLDDGRALAVDASGSAYVIGNTETRDQTPVCTQTFPITAGVFQTTHGSHGEDVFVTKLNPAGSALVYSTYLGGGIHGGPVNAPDDEGSGIAVDAAVNAYVTGITVSTDFPTTAGAFQTTLANNGFCSDFHTTENCSDAFVAKINSTATALLYSTFLGKNDIEEGNAIVIDALGRAYVTGSAESPDFPTTAGAYQTANRCAGTNAFVTVMNPTGTALVASTMIGGSTGVTGTNCSDAAQTILRDRAGNIYIAGHTRSADFPTTADALQKTHGGGGGGSSFFCQSGYCDGFVAKFDAGLSVLRYSSLLGGSGDDSPQALAADAVGNVYVAGATTSVNFPATAGALQTALPAGGVSGGWTGTLGLRTWTDTNLNHVPECDLTNPNANGECGAVANSTTVMSLQRNGAALVGGNQHDTVQGTLASQSSGSFTFNVTIATGCSVAPTGSLTANTATNALSATVYSTDTTCPIRTYSLQKVSEPPDGFVVRFKFPGARPAEDFDGDGKADVTVYRPGTGVWYILNSSSAYTTYSTATWGASTDVPVPGDYDGDGKTDAAIYRPSTGQWWVLLSSTGYTTYASYAWGVSTDVPVTGDYDGDGRTDVAIYRPSTGQWWVLLSASNYTTIASYTWGLGGDKPVPGDYDGDGKADVAVYRPSTGAWYVLTSGTNYTAFSTYVWGASTDVPVSADYDGDGKSDVAVYRPSTGTWYVLTSTSNYTSFGTYVWGLSTDVPVPADYDGDGKSDVAVYRPSTGTWYVLTSTSNYTAFSSYVWGASTDVPVLER